MRVFCLALALIVFVLSTAAGYFLGGQIAPLTKTFVSYDANVIIAVCTAAGAVLGLLGASGYVISAVLAHRIGKLERRVRRLGRGRTEG